MTPGDRVRIARDEKLHPPRGTWSRYSGKPGIVVMTRDEEVGVEVGVAQPRYNERHELQYDHARVAWFRQHELRSA